jgi:hypothetical protein
MAKSDQGFFAELYGGDVETIDADVISVVDANDEVWEIKLDGGRLTVQQRYPRNGRNMVALPRSANIVQFTTVNLKGK